MASRARRTGKSAAFAALFVVAAAAWALPVAAAETVVNLNSAWTLSNGQGVSLPVSLPKYALEAMQDAGLVGDPLWR